MGGAVGDSELTASSVSPAFQCFNVSFSLFPLLWGSHSCLVDIAPPLFPVFRPEIPGGDPGGRVEVDATPTKTS